jgi:ketosteroid isomerase-like protein
MKNLSIAVSIFTALALPSCAGPSEEVKASPAPSVIATPVENVENVEEVVAQLEKDWVAAIVNKDVAALDGLLAADFNGTSPTGATFPKSEAIAELKNGTYTVESMVMDEVSVNVYGSSAVAFTSQQEKSKVNGKDNSGHYHFTNVWVKRDGKWQVVASHGSRLANAK